MGLVIASGMSIGTIFTLFVVPMFYTFISRETVRAHRAEDRTPERHHHHQPVAAE
jgi:multidrug efflux pump